MRTMQPAARKPTLSYVIGDALYLNITDRCTLDCDFCPKNRAGPQVHDYNLVLDRRPDADEVIATIDDPARFREVVFCGFGEPTLRLKALLKIATHIKNRGGRVRVNTDGLANLVHKRNVLVELATCVDALSVSMNAHCEAVYQRHCHPAIPGSFTAMLNFLQRAPAFIDDVTATAIEGLEGVDIDACARLAEQRGVRFRKRVLDAVG